MNTENREHDFQTLYVSGFSETQKIDEIRAFCEKYGQFDSLTRPKSQYIFIHYESEELAKTAHERFILNGFDCRYGFVRLNASRNGSAMSNGKPANKFNQMTSTIRQGAYEIEKTNKYKDIRVTITQVFDDFSFTARQPNQNTDSHFFLHGVPRNVENDYAEKVFETYINTEVLIDADSSNVKPNSEVTLIDRQTKQPINDVIRDTFVAYKPNDIKDESPPIGSLQKFFVVDFSSFKMGNLITLFDGANKTRFFEQESRIQESGGRIKKYPQYKPEMDEMCMIDLLEEGYGRSWYRCRYIADVEDEPGKVLVHLIDWKKTVRVDAQNLRKMSKDCVELPVFTFAASIIIDEDDAYAPTHLELKERIDQSRTIRGTLFVSPGNHFYSIKIEN